MKKSVIVSEKRLSRIGKYNPTDPCYKNLEISPDTYQFSYALLQQVMHQISKESIQNELHKPDYQIIQMVKAVDDLIQSSNLLNERTSYWMQYDPRSNSIKRFEEVSNVMQKEIDRLQENIKEEMSVLAPNLSTLIGPILAARLLSLAGTMHRLSTMPASTIQILGAEKAFFRFKREGGKPPKHGVIYQHPLINNAARKHRGHFARTLALKIILAIRADFITKRDISAELQICLDERIKEIKKQ